MPSTNAPSSRKHSALKILLALLPAIVFTQAYAWMTLNRGIGYAFLILWALIVASVWQLTQKNRIVSRLLQLLEIGFFFLPVATIIMTFTAGATFMGQASSEFAKVGAVAGLAIGGFFVTVVAFMVGIIGGIITHLITKGYTAKAKKEPTEKETKLNQHGLAFALIGLILVSIILPMFISAPVSPTAEAPAEQAKNLPPESGEEDTVSPTSTPEAMTEPEATSPLKLGPVSITSNAINMPEATLAVTNISDKKIIALKIRLLIYTKFDEPVRYAFSLNDSNEFIGLSQDEELDPGEKANLTWQLMGYDNAGKATAEAYQVKFEDDTEWRSVNFKETTN